MLRGAPAPRQFSATASVTRGFDAPASSESSAASASLRPLEPEDVVIEILVDGHSARPLAHASPLDDAQTQHIVERSFFVVPLSATGRPTRRPLRSVRVALNDIFVAVNVSPEEGLLYGCSTLKSDEVEVVTAWLVSNYSLASLRRTSVQIVQDLDAAQERDPRLAESLEQRALVVAEATGRRAAEEAASEESGSRGGLRRTTRSMPPPVARRTPAADAAFGGHKRRRKADIIQETDCIEETLAQFNRKIAMFAVEDPATAEMLMPAKLDLESKLRHLRAQLASFGVNSDVASAGGVRGNALTPSAEAAEQFAPDPHAPEDEYMREESSSDDENDLRMALPIDGSEYDVPFTSSVSGRDGYVSSCDEEGDVAAVVRRPAEYVIDLSGSRSRPGRLALERSGHPDSEGDGADQPPPSSGRPVDDETFHLPTSPAMKSDFYTPRDSPRDSNSTVDYTSDLERAAAATPRTSRGANRKSWYSPSSASDQA